MVGSTGKSGAPCPVCGALMTGRQKSVCSDRCRATKSRHARILVKREELLEMRGLLHKVAIEVEKYLGRREE